MLSPIVWAIFAVAIFATLARAEDCRVGEWACQDGTCIPMDSKCDGKYDCRDNSDETHHLCWNHYCDKTRFRCAYGACVDGSARCNKVRDCQDDSDEFLAECRNEKPVHNGKFMCYDYSTILASELCDGKKDCAQGEDENILYCGGQRCKGYEFQCAYGACVDLDSACNEDRRRDCVDGSDEADLLCNRTTTDAPTTPTSFDGETSDDGAYSGVNSPEPEESTSPDSSALLQAPSSKGYRKYRDLIKTNIHETLRVTFVAMEPYLDEYSNRDSSQYQNFAKSLENAVNKIYEDHATSGEIGGTQRASVVKIQSRTSDDFSCKVTVEIVTTGYYDMDKITKILRDYIHSRRELEGVAVSELEFSANVIDPEFCELPRHHSVTYFCGDRLCKEREPHGTVVQPQCNSLYIPDNQYGQFSSMNCISNNWDYKPTCKFDISYETNENNFTIFIGGQEIVVRVSGTSYTVTVDHDNETIKAFPMAPVRRGPNERVSDDNEFDNNLGGSEKEPSPHFDPRYFDSRQ